MAFTALFGVGGVPLFSIERGRKNDVKAGKISPEELDENSFGSYLYDPELPEPDLVIRTSGELRISNFMLWEMAYSELYVTSVLWPDFDRSELQKALESFGGRKRRFGGVANK